jgi:DNA (cytosine-5)-methyltransferase 1
MMRLVVCRITLKPRTQKMNELALFAGAGGGILGGLLCGFRTVCAVEHDPYARDVLVSRQNDGCLAPFPIWDDVCTFDGKPWRGRVDVVSGGFPCQDISSAGKGAGIGGERSGLWREMARIIGEVGPRLVLVENSPLLVGRGLGLVLGDLAEMGYDATWGIVGARDAAAPHKRERIWIRGELANAGCEGLTAGRAGSGKAKDGEIQHLRTANGGASLANTAGAGLPDGIERPMGEPGAEPESERSDWWATEPDVGRMAHGVASRVDRLRCLGNGQVPACAALAFKILSSRLSKMA